MDELEGKVAVITGGASGIGFALATAFLAAGSRVVVADIEAPALDAARSRLGDGRSDRVHSVVTDVADLHSVEALAAGTLDRFGQVDILCNNAGVSTFNTVDQLTMADWHWVLGVDLWGVIHGVHTFLPIMLRQATAAHIVNTASIAGLVSGVAYLGPYAVAKVGVVSLSETLRSELGASGAPIGVSVLCPSATNTNVMEGERNRPVHLGAEERTVDAEAWRAAIRAGFTGPGGKEPEEIAGMVVDAVRTNRFWVVSHGDLRPALEQRFAEILDATPYQSSPA
jgi:NAD(P)-dependent dehydrogenase (short-subunit alcohol dehydrogenase family)